MESQKEGVRRRSCVGYPNRISWMNNTLCDGRRCIVHTSVHDSSLVKILERFHQVDKDLQPFTKDIFLMLLLFWVLLAAKERKFLLLKQRILLPLLNLVRQCALEFWKNHKIRICL